MAIADAMYKFVAIDIGAPGRCSDGGIWEATGLREAVKQSLPTEQQRLPNSDKVGHHYLVGDPAFPLQDYMIRPFAGRGLPHAKAVFNYRHSRARRVVENAFGIASARWRVWRHPIEASPYMVILISKAVCVLHNFAMSHESNTTDTFKRITEIYQQEQPNKAKLPPNNLHPIKFESNNKRSNKKGAELRDTLKNFFVNEGQVTWQNDIVLYNCNEND